MLLVVVLPELLLLVVVLPELLLAPPPPPAPPLPPEPPLPLLVVVVLPVPVEVVLVELPPVPPVAWPPHAARRGRSPRGRAACHVPLRVRSGSSSCPDLSCERSKQRGCHGADPIFSSPSWGTRTAVRSVGSPSCDPPDRGRRAALLPSRFERARSAGDHRVHGRPACPRAPAIAEVAGPQRVSPGGRPHALLFAVSWLLRKSARARRGGARGRLLIFYGAHVINDPHFAVTYLLFYRDARARALGGAFGPAQRARYSSRGSWSRSGSRRGQSRRSRRNRPSPRPDHPAHVPARRLALRQAGLRRDDGARGEARRAVSAARAPGDPRALLRRLGLRVGEPATPARRSRRRASCTRRSRTRPGSSA